MPELPEVETIRIGLKRLLPGRKVLSVKWDWPKGFPNAQADVDNFLVGATIKGVRRRAKVLLIDLDTDYTLVTHLKMTGQLVYRSNDDLERFGAGHPNKSLIGNLPDKSTRVIIDLSEITGPRGFSARNERSAEQGVQEVRGVSTVDRDDAIDHERWRSYGLRPEAGYRGGRLFFNDQRKFGWMRLMPTLEVEQLDFFKKVGPEPLAADFTAKHFIERMRRRKNSGIKAVLLDQTVIAGVGNIYADESLWGAKIHPSTIVKDIPGSRLKKLFQELQLVLRLSIEKGGSTDKNYLNAEGKKGSYLEFAKVFRRENLPCPRCGHTIIKLRVAGRGTHICPNCQKL